MKKILFILTFFVCVGVSAQQYFFNGTVYVPKTTTEINAISSPTEGRLEYNSTTESMWLYDGSSWIDTGSSGDLWSDPVDSNIAFDTNDSYDIGSLSAILSNLYVDDVRGFSANPRILLQDTDNTDNRGFQISVQNNTNDLIFLSFDNSPSNYGSYTLNGTGTPSNDTDLIDKEYADDNYAGGGSSFPVDADEAIIQDETDNTKQVDFDLSGVTTGTKHTITMPDADVDLGAISDDQTLSLGGTNNDDLTIEDGNTITIPNLANQNQDTPVSSSRDITVGSLANFTIRDSGGGMGFGILSGSGPAEGTYYLNRNLYFGENLGAAITGDEATWTFNFDTGGEKDLVFTPTDVQYDGNTLLGGSGNNQTTFKDVTSSTYTLLTTDSDDNTKIRFDNAGEITVSEPGSTPSDGDNFRLVQYGIGQVVPDFPVNITADSSLYVSTDGLGANILLEYDDTNTRYDVTGKWAMAIPTVPTGLNVTDSTSTSITYNWTASTRNVAGYEYSLDDGAAVDVGNVTTHEVTGLTESTFYDFKVRAYNDEDNASAYTTNLNHGTDGPAALYTEADAADPNNETNTVGGNWAAEGSDPIEINSSAVEFDDGSYSLNINVTGTQALPEMELTCVNISNGDNVTITGRIYENQGNWVAWLTTANGWDVEDISSGFANNTWETFSVTATATQDDPLLAIRGPSDSANGYDAFVDNIVITIN